MQIVLSVTVMLVDIYNHACDCFSCNHAALLQMTVFASNLWVTVFIVFMQMEVSVAIMQVVLSAAFTSYAPIFWRINRTPVSILFVTW